MNDAQTRLRTLPIWSGPIVIEPLHGGLSNENFKVTDGQHAFVARLGRDFPFHHVLRKREIMTARAAFHAGFAPEVIYAESPARRVRQPETGAEEEAGAGSGDAEGPDASGVMVSRFIEGHTYGEADVRENIATIASRIADFHQQVGRHVSGPGFIFWVFHVIRDYARILDAGNSRMRSNLAEFVALANRLEAVQVALPIVFGHHDLLPANFIQDENQLWLIDFEYAGFGTPMFDLAGIASNAGFETEQSEALLAAYFGRIPDAELKRSHAAMQCASLLREAMWSMVSELYLNAPGVDYVAYTATNLERLERSLADYASIYGKA